MKKIIGLFLLLGVGCTVGKNYFLYQHVVDFQKKNPDQVKIDDLSWGWMSGVQMTNMHLSPHSTPDKQMLIQTTTINHSWLSPLHIRIQLDDIKGKNAKILQLKGSFGYSSNAITSTDLIILNAEVSLKKGTFIAPLIKCPFTYYYQEKKIDLDFSIPSSPQGTLKNLSVGAKGALTLEPKINGKLDLQVDGVSKLIDALVEADIIKKKNAVFFELGSKLFTNDKDQTTLHLSFDKGDVYLGPILIYKDTLAE